MGNHSAYSYVMPYQTCHDIYTALPRLLSSPNVLRLWLPCQPSAPKGVACNRHSGYSGLHWVWRLFKSVTSRKWRKGSAVNRNAISLGVALAIVVSLASGCATLGKKSPEEMVRMQLESWREALLAHDVDQLMTYYSEDFTSDQSGSKEDVREFIQGAIDAGYIDNAEVILENTVITVEGDQAVATPIELRGPMDGVAIKLEFVHEEDGWLIDYSSEA